MRTTFTKGILALTVVCATSTASAGWLSEQLKNPIRALEAPMDMLNPETHVQMAVNPHAVLTKHTSAMMPEGMPSSLGKSSPIMGSVAKVMDKTKLAVPSPTPALIPMSRGERVVRPMPPSRVMLKNTGLKEKISLPTCGVMDRASCL
jgi:hypothetical protein